MKKSEIVVTVVLVVVIIVGLLTFTRLFGLWPNWMIETELVIKSTL